MGTEEKTIHSNNNVIRISKKIISIYIVILFAIIWLGYYNFFAFRTNREIGGALSIVIYYIVYQHLAKLYKAFKIGTYQIGEVVFSQILAIGMSDAILYAECCLIARGYVNIIPGLLVAALQLIGMVVWAVVAKRYFIRHIKSSETIIIYGREDVENFIGKLQKKYKHLFDIKEWISSDEPIEVIKGKIEQCDTVMLYEIDSSIRTQLMEICLEKQKSFYMTPRIEDIIIQGFDNRTLIDTPLLKYEYSYIQPKTYHWKRVLDLVISVVCLVIFAIPMLIVTIAIKLEDGGPVFFKQQRCTKGEKVFEILKFRSMIVDAERDEAVIPCVDGDSRITKVGKIIRRFRIDEVPQFINVLKGEMSVVGPRPERIEHVSEYTKELPQFSYRHRVNGGITGYAQIYGKYNTSAYDKLKLDLMYIENQSLLMDLKLIMLTLKIMFLAESTEGFEQEKSKLISEWDCKYTLEKSEKKVV